MAILGVDVGGTFTDAVLFDEREIRTAKVVTSERQEESVVAAAHAVGAHDLERFAHGTTVATNALLERKGARTAFVTNAGFEDLLHLRRQTRAHLYRLCAQHPEPLVPRDRCYGVRGRMMRDGELEPIALETLPDIDADAVAVCLLHADRHPAHERLVVGELRRRLPHAHVVASHEVAPEFREYERASTTTADAYLGPVAARYLSALSQACNDAGLREPLVMRSSGGVATPAEAAAHPATILVSGPAAGAVGAAMLASRAGFQDAIGLDMGGTSTDVCLITSGRAERASERALGGLPMRLPTVDIHTVGAGGGSLVWRDRGGALRIGPQSAGADPGPACYGRGGTQATVTDANLLLGRLPDELAAGVALDRGAAERALDGVDPSAVVDVVNAEMLRALRLVSVERGHDPQGFALVAFGGAGPLHACELAEELGIDAVVVPETAGVLSALGLVASDERRDRVTSYVTLLENAGELPRDGEADLRYTGQSFELTLPLQEDLARAFHRAHEEQYGFADGERAIELVAVRTAETKPAPQLTFPTSTPRRLEGAARVELDGATLWIPPGWVGVRDGTAWTVTRT